MIKTFKYAIAALAMTATAGIAGGEPWANAAPKGTVGAHQQMAAQAAQVDARTADFGENPLAINWKGTGDKYTDYPMSNVPASTLTSAITGRYHVFQDPGQQKWSVRYYGADGDVYFCVANGRGKHKEYKNHYAVSHTRAGLAGVLLWGTTKRTPSGEHSYAWPLVVDSTTSDVAIYAYHRKKWKPQPGWIQSEYAPAFAENCPKLPRVNAVSNQTGDTLQELARSARSVKVQPAFANSTRSPLTAGMYYHFNPPVR